MMKVSSMTREELERRVTLVLEYYKTESGKIATRKASLKYYRKNREKVNARKRELYAERKAKNFLEKSLAKSKVKV